MLLVATERKNRIRQILRAKKITPYKLAQMVEMSRNAIYGLVKAPQIPEGTDYITVWKVAKALQVPINELEEEVESS